jgi:putative transposase
MPDYRRAFAPGGTFFFTLVTERRAAILCDARARHGLRAAFHATAARWPFSVLAIVLLPDHLHAIWSLPPDDPDYSRRWAYLKKCFTHRWLAAAGDEQPVTPSRRRNRRRGVWQRRYWEHLIRDELDLERHVDYIHHNPVKHGLATCPHVWPYSSFGRWVSAGCYDVEWHCSCHGRSVPPPCFDDLAATAME